MFCEHKNIKILVLKPLSNTHQFSTINFVNKNKRRCLLSRNLFRPYCLKKKTRTRKLSKYMWFFSNYQIFRRQNSPRTIFSMQYLKKKGLDIEGTDLKLKIGSRQYVRKYLRRYVKKEVDEYLNLFHKKDKNQKELFTLKGSFKTQLSKFFFLPWKKVLLAPTERQHWLNNMYSRYQNLRFKDRIDFFRTYLGQMLGRAYWKYGEQVDEQGPLFFSRISNHPNAKLF